MMKGHRKSDLHNVQNDPQEKKCTQQYMQKNHAIISSELATNIQESNCEIFWKTCYDISSVLSSN